METPEKTQLLIEVDKKLDILISGYENDKIANREFKRETREAINELGKDTKAERSKIFERLNKIEEWKAGMMVDQKTISSVKDSIVKWVIGSMLTLIGSSTIIISILLKGGA